MMIGSTVIGIGVVVVVFTILILFGLVAMINKFLRKIEPGKALIIIRPFSKKGPKVSFSGGIVLPLLHKAEIMDISTKVMTVTRKGTDGLICKDNVRADITVHFYIRVNSVPEDVLKVATTIGCARASTHETLNELFQAKFSEALKTVGKQMEYAELFKERTVFKEEIIKTIGQDLNGYRLEDTAIDYLAQTPVDQLDPRDIMDSEGIKKITELTSIQAIRTNEINREKEETVTKRDVEAQERIFELKRQEAEAEARQKAEIAMIRAREEAEQRRVEQEERLKAEQARVRTEEQLSIAEANKNREVEIAEKNRERAVVLETERIEKDRQLEVTEREKTVAIATIEKDKAVEQEKKAIQDIIRQRVAVERTVAEEEERIKDTRAFADADRQKKVAIVEAEQLAEQELIKDIKSAEAKERAAVHEAKEKEIRAEVEKVTAIKVAEAKQTMAQGVIAEESASGLAHVKVQEAEADAIKKKGEAEAEAKRLMGSAEADNIHNIGASEAKVGEARAVVVQKQGTAEAEAKRQMGLAEAEATQKMGEAQARARFQMGEAEARALQANYDAEAIGIKEKAESMKLYDAVGREHEEFKLKLATREKIAIEEIDVRKDIAIAQAEVLASAMKSANIDIVGGEGQFFDNLVNSIIEGKTKSALIESNSVLSELKDALLQPGDDNLVKKLRHLLDEVGISSEDVKNLSVSALISTLNQSTDEPPLLDRIGNLKNMVEKYGLGDLVVSLKDTP
jgi:uncharacterized membrane protein YqiK